jgi:hypothetical protein
MLKVHDIDDEIIIRIARSEGMVKQLSFYRAYADDSGKEDTPVLIVGGILIRDSSCDEFCLSWGKVLRDWKVKKFHASELWAGKGEFEGWTDDYKYEFEFALIKVMLKYQCLIFGTGVSLKSFRAVAPEFPSVKMNPYKLAVLDCVSKLMRWMGENAKNKPLHLFICPGAGSHSSPHMLKWRDQLEHGEMQRRYGVGKITTLDSNDSSFAQSADLAAYEWFRFLRPIEEGIAKRMGLRPSMVKLRGRVIKAAGARITQEGVREAFESILALIKSEAKRNAK